MSEEYTSVKISMPLIDDIELQRIDTFYNDIVSEYTKAFVKEKEQVIIQRCMMNLQQENQQLKEKINQYENPEDLTLFYMWLDEKAKDKIKELKNQQKEFIKYLEDESKEVKRDAGYHKRICLEILSKYKEIIGSDVK